MTQQSTLKRKQALPHVQKQSCSSGARCNGWASFRLSSVKHAVSVPSRRGKRLQVVCQGMLLNCHEGVLYQQKWADMVSRWLNPDLHLPCVQSIEKLPVLPGFFEFVGILFTGVSVDSSRCCPYASQGLSSKAGLALLGPLRTLGVSTSSP